MEVSKTIDPTSTPWAQNGSYPPRMGNDILILIDGQSAYKEIADAFKKAKKFIYLTISYGALDFLLVPESEETLFYILMSRSNDGVDVRMVAWQPASNTTDTIPDPAPGKIPGVNEGAGSIQARWDKAKGYSGWYRSPHGHFEPFYLDFPAQLGCHHQKTYIMDDGGAGWVAFVGGINPVQAYWDTPAHDSLDVRRVEWKYPNPLKRLEATPPLHDIFYQINGPAVGDVLANFVERYNGASIRYAYMTSDAVAPITPDQIPPVPNGIEVQVLRTIAPNTYPATPKGDTGIRELYLNALMAAGEGSLVYIENQYFFDHGIISEIHEAAERGAKIIALLTSKPDEGLLQGKVESLLEQIAHYQEEFRLVAGHSNVALLTLGNSRPDPRTPGKFIYSETYIHSKTMAVFTPDWAAMSGGSANIAFTSMWFHSEMNIAFMDPARIKNWVAQLWSEHLQISVEDAIGLIERPDDALTFFRVQADRNLAALKQGQQPEGRVYYWKGTNFPARNLTGINLGSVLFVETRSRINVKHLADSMKVLSSEFGSGSPRGAIGDTRLTIADHERLRAAYAPFQQEFGNAIKGIRNLMRWVIAFILIAVAVSIAGGALLQVTPYAGLISLAGIGGLFRLLTRARQLWIEQAMLELIPARYSLLIEMCNTNEDALNLIRSLDAEISTLQGDKKRRQD